MEKLDSSAYLATSLAAEYTEAECEEGMQCARFVLEAGDTLYLPRGAIHHATATAERSVHFTIGLRQDNVCWHSVVLHAIELIGDMDQTAANGAADALGYTMKQPFATIFYQPVPFIAEIAAGQLSDELRAALAQTLRGMFGIIEAALSAQFQGGGRRQPWPRASRYSRRGSSSSR